MSLYLLLGAFWADSYPHACCGMFPADMLTFSGGADSNDHTNLSGLFCHWTGNCITVVSRAWDCDRHTTSYLYDARMLLVASLSCASETIWAFARIKSQHSRRHPSWFGSPSKLTFPVQVVKELRKTEESYVEHLEILDRLYLSPLKVVAALSAP